MATQKKGNIGTFTASEFLDIIDELTSGSKNIKSKNGNIDVTVNVNGNASEKMENITEKTKDATTAMDSFANTAKRAGESVGKSMEQAAQKTEKVVKTISKEYKQLNGLDFSVGEKGKKKSKFDDVSNLINDDSIKDAKKKIEKNINTLKKSMESYKNEISEIQYSFNHFDPKGVHSSKLYSNFEGDLFDSKEVDKSIKSFMDESNISKEMFSKVEKILTNREKLYSSLQNLKSKHDYKTTDFSDPQKNKEMLQDMSLMVEIAKKIEYLDGQIEKATGNKSKNTVNSSVLEKQANQLANSMTSQNTFTKIFGEQFTEVKTLYDNFIAYIQEGLRKGFDNVDFSKVSNGIENLTNGAKKAKNEISGIADEVKNVNTYLFESTELTGKTRYTYDNLDQGKQKTIKDKGKQYEFVGQITNAKKNGAQFEESSKAYQYYLKLLEENEELRNFANEIMNTQVSSASAASASSVNAEKVKEETEKRKELNAELERSRELGVEVSTIEGTDSTETRSIEEQTEALKKLNDEKERSEKLGVTNDNEQLAQAQTSDSNRKLFGNKASNLKELREEYSVLRSINHDLEIYNRQRDDVPKTRSSKEELEHFKQEILEANPQLQQLADSTERISRTKFNEMFKDSFISDSNLETDVSSFITTVSKLENYANADPQWMVDYTDKIRNGEISLSDALDEYKNKLSTKMQEIADEQERNRINNEQVKIFADNFGDISNLDPNKLSKYTEILNQISSGALSAADGIEQFNAALNATSGTSENEFETLLGKDFSTKNKTEATKQLKQAYENYKPFFENNDQTGNISVAGAKAGYEYCKAFQEAVNKGISVNNLNKYSIDQNRYGESNWFDKYNKTTSEDFDEILKMYNTRIQIFSSIIDEVKSKFGNIDFNTDVFEGLEGTTPTTVIQTINEYVAAVERLNDMKESVSSEYGLFDQSDIEDQTSYIESLKENVMDLAEIAPQVGSQVKDEYIGVASAQQEVIENQERINNTSSTSVTSTQVEETTQKVKELTQAEIEAAEKSKEIGQTFGITNKNALKEIQDVILAYRQGDNTELQTDENGFLIGGDFDDEVALFENAGTSINDVLNTISKHIKASKEDNEAYIESWKEVRKYISNSKINISDGVKSELGDDYQSMLSTIGRKNITTDGSGTDIISFLSEMNNQLGTTFDLTVSNQDAFRELYDFLKNKPLEIDIDSLPESIRKTVNQILNDSYGEKTNRKYNSPKIKDAKFNTNSNSTNFEQEAKSSTESTDAIVANEEEKQQAYKESSLTAENAAEKTIASEEKIAKALRATVDDHKKIDPTKMLGAVKANELEQKRKQNGTYLSSVLGLKNDSDIGFSAEEIIAKFGSIENAAKELHNALEQGFNIHDFIENYKSDLDLVGQIAENAVDRVEAANRQEEVSDNLTDSSTQLELYKQEQQAADATADAIEQAEQRKQTVDTETTDVIIQNSKRRQQAYEDDVEHWSGEVEDTIPKDPNRRIAIKTTDSSTKQSTTYQEGRGRTTEEGVKLNKRTGEWEPFYNTLTNMVQVENEAVKWTNKLTLAQADLESEMRKTEPAQNVLDAINDQIDIYQEILNKVNQRAEELASENNSPFSYDDYSERVKERTDPYKAEIATKTAKQIRVENEQALREQEKLEELQSKYTKKLSSINGGFKHLKEYTDVQSAISGLVDPDDVSQVESAFNRLEKVINDFKQNVKSSASLDPIFNAMKTKDNIDSIVDDYETKFRELGLSSDKAKEKVKELFDIANRIKSIDLKSKTGMSKLGEEINKFNTERNKLDISLKTTRSSNRIDNNVEKAYKQLADTEERYLTLVSKEKVGTATKDQLAELKELNAEREKAYNTTRQRAAATAEETAAQQRYNEVLKQSDNVLEQYVNKEQQIKSLIDSSSAMLNSFANNPNNISGFDDVYKYYEQKISDLNNKLNNTKNPTTSTFDKYKKDIAQIEKELRSTVRGNVGGLVEAEDAMRDYFASIGVASDKVGDFVDKNNTLSATFEDSDGKLRKITLRYNQFTDSIEVANNKIVETQSVSKKFLEGLKGRFMALGQYLLSFASFYDIINKFREGITIIRDLDTALTEMRKVSDESIESLKNFQKVSFDVASSIGSTAKQIQNSAADFMRLGYDLNEASELAKDANIYANVGDMGIDEATEHMISSIQAWKSEFSSEVEASEAIVDRYNEIGNNFAITSADIGSAMERSAAALKAGGNTLNESLGLITAGNLVQQDADTTANALKVMSLRIRGSKTELEEMGESTDDLASSTSKLRDEILALSGVDIMADENTYKSTAQIIQEIGAVFDKLSDVSQASLLEKLAGKTRASTVAGLLENYEVIGEVIDAAENADGSAIKENERYLDSIEGRIQQFTNEVQEFWYNLIDSETIKGAISLATKFMDLLGNIVGYLGEIGTLATVISGGFGIKKIANKISGKDSGGRVKEVYPHKKYATESFSREVCEFLCISE